MIMKSRIPGQQRIMAGVDSIREMLDRTLGSGNWK
jgi:hypothetical protein